MKILAISGSSRSNSTNLQILKALPQYLNSDIDYEIFSDINSLPHFDPDKTHDDTPDSILLLREKIQDSDAVIICSPEYVFSIPSALKNILEWMVSTTQFSGKATAVITASSSGKISHESLLRVVKTLEAKIDDSTQLLISGARAKLNESGQITDTETIQKLKLLLKNLIRNTSL